MVWTIDAPLFLILVPLPINYQKYFVIKQKRPKKFKFRLQITCFPNPRPKMKVIFLALFLLVISSAQAILAEDFNTNFISIQSNGQTNDILGKLYGNDQSTKDSTRLNRKFILVESENEHRHELSITIRGGGGGGGRGRGGGGFIMVGAGAGVFLYVILFLIFLFVYIKYLKWLISCNDTQPNEECNDK